MLGKAAKLAGTIAIASVVAACLNLPGTGTIDGNFDFPPGTQPDLQTQIGAREHPKVVAAYGSVYRNKGAELEIARVVGDLVAASENPAQSYAITLLNSPSVNAFALPGGYLYVTRGLLALANDEAELGAVIAHEMAHVTRNHAIDRSRRAVATDLADRVLTQVVDDPQVAEQARLESERSFAEFTQAQELQADEVGIRTLARAGLDPFAASRFLEAMDRFSRVKNAGYYANANAPSFLASHPTTPRRISMARSVARQFGAPSPGQSNPDRYLMSIDGLRFGDTEEEGFVRGRRYVHKKLGIQFVVPQSYVIENTREAVLATNSDRTAMRFDGVKIKRGQSLENYLRSGWVNGLDGNSIRTSLTSDGSELGTASAMAQGWSYKIGIIRSGIAAYRFIFATRQPTLAFRNAFDETVGSFRGLTREEAHNIGPLAIKVRRVEPGETFERIAANGMNDVPANQGGDLLRALNGYSAGQQPRTNKLIKTIVEVRD